MHTQTFKQEFELILQATLRMILQHPAFLDKHLCEELLEIANQDKAYKSVIGKTMCTYDFYEGKGVYM